MALIRLQWDNSDVAFAASVSGMRMSKRIKAIGGTWDTAGFNPLNDFVKGTDEVDATVTANRVYEFKLESLCSGGGTTQNLNGIVEGIVFECIEPEFLTVTHNAITARISLLNLDITKARFVLRRASDDFVVGTVTANKVGNYATANFSGLVEETDYYLQIELYAVVGGVEVISSDSFYLNDACGGSAEYDVSTLASGDPVELEGGIGNTISAACSSSTTFYLSSEYPTNNIVYIDSGLSTPYTGYSYIKLPTGQVYELDPVTGQVGAEVSSGCGGNLTISNTMDPGNSIDSITPPFYYIAIGALPVDGGEMATGGHGGNSASIPVEVTLTDAAEIVYNVNGVDISTTPAAASGTHNIPAYTADSGDNITITLQAV